MNKIIYADHHDELVKLAGRIETFFDGNEQSIKSASSSAISEEMMREHKPDDDHFGVHLIAMGSGESYGPNKNGDHWPRDELIKRHNTFKTHGNFFREHRNNDPKNAIGKVAASAFNEKMDRVELIVHGDKRAAEEEYQKAKNGRPLGFSMSASVVADRCSCCGHRAKSSKHYCRHLKHSMTQYLPEFSKFAYAINEHPTFFDISRVGSPADRIAYHIQYSLPEDDKEARDGLSKAASVEESFPFSDRLAEAEGISEPKAARDPKLQDWLEKLAEGESYLGKVANCPDNVAKDDRYRFATEVIPYAFDKEAMSDEAVGHLRSIPPRILWEEMAKRAAVLPFDVFWAYCTNQSLDETRKSAAFGYAWEHEIGKAFSKAACQCLDSELENDMQPADGISSVMCHRPDPVQKLMDEVAEDYSVEEPKVRSRVFRIRLKPKSEEKSASSQDNVSDDQRKLAERISLAYAVNKASIAKTASELYGKNSIDLAETLLIASNKI